MSRIVRMTIPIILLAIFITIMTTGAFVKKPMNKEDDVLALLHELETGIMNEEWEVARSDLEHTKHAWEKVVKRIQYSAELGEISSFHIALERIEGYIQAKDKGGAMAEIAEANYIWSELGK